MLNTQTFTPLAKAYDGYYPPLVVATAKVVAPPPVDAPVVQKPQEPRRFQRVSLEELPPPRDGIQLSKIEFAFLCMLAGAGLALVLDSGRRRVSSS